MTIVSGNFINMKKLTFINLHLYAGLFVFFYLMAFGISTLVLNHDLDRRIETTGTPQTWQAQAVIDANLADLPLAESIRDQLGIMGWPAGWTLKRNAELLKFEINHPGRRYHLTVNTLSGQVTITESSKGLLATFEALHIFDGSLPNAPLFIKSWAVYQWLGLLVMSISLILGIWLWLRYSYKPWQGIVFGSLFVGTILLMVLV